MAKHVSVGRSPFLETYGVPCEIAYKRKCTEEGRIMMHAQIGFRDAAKSRRAWAEIWEALDKAGHRVDRYGICLDWSMGYPRAKRKDMPRGTGLIMEDVEDWIALTQMAPVAPHFGDFVIGTPAAFENTIAALCSRLHLDRKSRTVFRVSPAALGRRHLHHRGVAEGDRAHRSAARRCHRSFEHRRRLRLDVHRSCLFARRHPARAIYRR